MVKMMMMMLLGGGDGKESMLYGEMSFIVCVF